MSTEENKNNTNEENKNEEKKQEEEKEEEKIKKEKKKAELIIISDNDSFKAPNSLQANFKNFRAYVQSMKRKNKELKPKSFRDSPERIQELREKFLEVAKSLLGIPYGKKYLIKHPDYDGGLFLDCCGLVRHVVLLLKEEFGFRLANWNQGYQYDVLGDEIKFEEMKPGDLIFYSGRYYPDHSLRKQAHDMVHVEIYLGEGEKTIGSRNSDGVVGIFDTFQFYSEHYYNITYHFKSIEPWLRGIHKSFCKEHKWHEEGEEEIKNNKYSCFYNADDDED